MKIIIEDIDSENIKVISESNITCKNITIYQNKNKLELYSNKYLQALYDHFTKIKKEK